MSPSRSGSSIDRSRASSKVVKVADFASQEYWQQRFTREESFEWLQPSKSIIPAIEAEIRETMGFVQARQTATLLHIGSGSSDLSNHLRRLLPIVKDHQADLENRSLIFNVDFSPTAIDLGRRREREEFGNSPGSMRWAVVDLLDWQSFKYVCEDNCGKAFDIIIEKSCTDALACGPNIKISWSSSMKESSRPLLEEELRTPMAPASVLAIHLAAVTQPGAAWIALSYSAGRFDFLQDSDDPAAPKWSVERVQRLSVNSSGGNGAEDGVVVYRPDVVHFLYVLRRSSS